MGSRMRTLLVVLSFVGFLVRSTNAAPPDVATMVGKMKAALEPPKASVRQLKLSISTEDSTPTQWTLAEARKSVDGQDRKSVV